MKIAKEENNLCLLLGAGASAEQHLPDWKKLVEGVIKYNHLKLNVTKENLTESITVLEDSIVGSFRNEADELGIRFSSDDYQFFARRQIAMATRSCLKRNLFGRTYNDIIDQMETMRVIAENTYNRLKKNQLTTIITYNFDDYFEFCFKYLLKEKGELEKYSEYLTSYTIGDIKHHLPSGEQEKTLINVYHVHGFIPVFDEMFGNILYEENKEQYKKHQKNEYTKFLDCGIIFSGNDYNSLINDTIVGWTNMIQYICYSQLSISIVGFSLTDANFRTLIQRMKKSNQKMKKVMLFLGYPKDDLDQKLIAESAETTAQNVLSGVCDMGYYEHKICTFGKEYALELKNHLNTFLIQ